MSNAGTIDINEITLATSKARALADLIVESNADGLLPGSLESVGYMIIDELDRADSFLKGKTKDDRPSQPNTTQQASTNGKDGEQQQVIDMLMDLLDRVKKGEIRGLAFVTLNKNSRYATGFSGSIGSDPILALGASERLRDRLLKHCEEHGY